MSAEWGVRNGDMLELPNEKTNDILYGRGMR